MRVLVVSEDTGERLRATGALRARPGVEIVESDSVDEAHQLISQDDFDVIVMDGDLKPEGGFSVLYEMRGRAQMEGSTMPPSIILIAREDDRWLARWAGATEAIVKPIDGFAVARRVVELTEERAPVSAATAGETVGQAVAMDRPPPLDREDAPAVVAAEEQSTPATAEG